MNFFNLLPRRNKMIYTILARSFAPGFNQKPPIITELLKKEKFMIKFAEILQKDKKGINLMGMHQLVRTTLLETLNEIKIFHQDKFFEKLIDYNSLDGKKMRALAIIEAYKAFEDSRKLTLSNLEAAAILGWCVELLQSYLCIVDDILDNANMRRGKLCWYKHIGLNAVYHVTWIKEGIFYILKRYFSTHPSYELIIASFHSIILKTFLGQALDTNLEGKLNLKDFTISRYQSIVLYKTTYYSIQLPIFLAAHLACKRHVDVQMNYNLLSLMGCLLQAKNDFDDLYGSKKMIDDEFQDDISQGKCTWFVVKALEIANSDQRAVLEEYYGSAQIRAVEIVKSLYNELNLKNSFYNYKELSLSLIDAYINEIAAEISPKVFSIYIYGYLAKKGISVTQLSSKK